jgi:hypothetical protein
MKRHRIEQAVQVIKYAIEYGISVKEASVKCGYSDTYVKNIKAQIIDKYDNNIITKEDYDFFMSNYQLYEGTKGIKKHTSTPINIEKNKRIVGENVKQEVVGDDMTVTWSGDSDKFDGEDDGLQGNFYGHQGYPPNHIKTLDALLERSGVNLNEWEVVRHIVNKWDVTSWKQGFPQTWENFQVKATLERIKAAKDARSFEEIFKTMVKHYSPPVIDSDAIPTFEVTEGDGENNLLEISLFDLHFGKLGWRGEVGENFDTKIARTRFLEGIETLLIRAKGFTYNEIVFPIGNDFFNSDNQFNTTTKGTPQDEDLRWQKTYDLGCKLIVDAIMMLKATGVSIKVPVIPGNHDQEKSYYLGSFVKAWFRDDQQVTIDNSAMTRKYIEWGEVMLGYTHGNEEKENSLPMLMATEEKKMWGRTSYHEWHLGHFHKKRNVKFTVMDKAQVLNEEHAVTVRYLSSLTGTEEWHYKKGYVGTTKAGEAFIWNDKTGLIGHLNANFVIGKK